MDKSQSHILFLNCNSHPSRRMDAHPPGLTEKHELGHAVLVPVQVHAEPGWKGNANQHLGEDIAALEPHLPLRSNEKTKLKDLVQSDQVIYLHIFLGCKKQFHQWQRFGVIMVEMKQWYFDIYFFHKSIVPQQIN